MPNKESTQSVIQQCAKIEYEMTALTKELRQKTAELKAFFKRYNEKHATLNTEWHKLFFSMPKDDEVLKEYWDLTADLEKQT